MNTISQLLLFLAILLPTFVIGQKSFIEPGKTSITTNEHFTLTVSAQYQKQLLAGTFPEIADLSKSRTEYIKDDTLVRVVQYYKPRKTGNFTLAPFTYTLNGDSIHFKESITIEVKNPVSKHLPEKFFYDEELLSPFEYLFPENVMLKVLVSRNDIYEGEDVGIRFCLDIPADMRTEMNFIDLKEQIEQASKIIRNKNCWLEDIALPEMVGYENVYQSGAHYRRFELYAARLTPIRPIDVQLPSLEFRILGYGLSKNRLFTERKDTLYTFKSKEQTIKVRELPQGLKHLPPGLFVLKERLSRNNTIKGKAVTYELQINGNRDLRSLPEPKLKRNERIEVYPISSELLSPKSKVFRYQIVPKETGTHDLSDLFYWPYFHTTKAGADTLYPTYKINVIGDEESFLPFHHMDPVYEKIAYTNNKLQRAGKDNMIRLFSNLVILFMLAFTAFLKFRK